MCFAVKAKAELNRRCASKMGGLWPEFFIAKVAATATKILTFAATAGECRIAVTPTGELTLMSDQWASAEVAATGVNAVTIAVHCMELPVEVVERDSTILTTQVC